MPQVDVMRQWSKEWNSLSDQDWHMRYRDPVN